MNGIRRLVASFALVASACATVVTVPSLPTPEAAAALAPTGRLRVGVYAGSPTSYIPGEGGAAPRGIAYDLGEKLAHQSRLPFEPVVFPSNDKLLDAVKAGTVDLVFTNATAARAQFIDFTPTVLALDKSYLVPPASTIREAAQVDRSGVRIGVSRGSSTEGELKHILKHATLVPVPSLDEAIRAMSRGELDAFGTNNAILFQMSDRLPGSRVLDGRWGAEAFAFGIPKGRAAAMPYLGRFVQEQIDARGVRAAAERAGVRGLSTEAIR